MYESPITKAFWGYSELILSKRRLYLKKWRLYFFCKVPLFEKTVALNFPKVAL